MRTSLTITFAGRVYHFLFLYLKWSSKDDKIICGCFSELCTIPSLLQKWNTNLCLFSFFFHFKGPRRNIWLFAVILESLHRSTKFGKVRSDNMNDELMHEWINVFIWIKCPFFCCIIPYCPWCLFYCFPSFWLSGWLRETDESFWWTGRKGQVGVYNFHSPWTWLSALSSGAWSRGR